MLKENDIRLDVPFEGEKVRTRHKHLFPIDVTEADHSFGKPLGWHARLRKNLACAFYFAHL